MSAFLTPEFWLALSQIILINIVLSGDNAVVIALASRSLPPQQQKRAILFGSVGAIVLRIILTFFAIYLLSLPYLKLVGAALPAVAASVRRAGPVAQFAPGTCNDAGWGRAGDFRAR